MPQPKKQKIDGIVTRAVDTSVDSIDPNTRTLVVSFSSEQPVTRRSWWDESWIETLGHNPGECDLQRLSASAPVFYNHRRDDPSLRIGVVERAWIEGRRGYAQLRISQRDEVAGIWQDIASGVLVNISVGYLVDERTLIRQVDGAPDEYRVTKWTPLEISFVDIPADHTVGVNRNYSVFDLEDPEMTGRKDDSIISSEPTAVSDAVDTDAIRREAEQQFRSAEGARREEIRTMLAPFAAQYPAEFQRCMDDMSISPADASQIMLRAAGAGLSPTCITTPAQVVRDEQRTRRDGFAELLLHRAMPEQFKLTENAQRFVGVSLMDIARRSIDGNADSFARHEIVQRALSTSDFTYLLANLANKTLRAQYENSPRTYLPITRINYAPDFKTITRAQLSGAPALEEVPEMGEYKHASMSDAAEQYAIKTFGKIARFSRQAIINDDLGAFTRMLSLYAASAANLESDLAWAQITGNPTMGDGVALFHATHKNLEASGSIISVDSLASGRAKMRVQTGLDGALLNLMPAYLIVPAALETLAEKYIAQNQIVAAKAVDFNPFAGRLQLIPEPRLDAVSATAWYLSAAPAQVDVLEMAYLDGTNGIYTEEKQGFDTDGYEIKVRLDVAAKVIDSRGLYKNPGA